MRSVASWLAGLALLALLGSVGCPSNGAVECRDNASCDQSAGGACVVAATGNQWCAFPDPLCPSGMRFSDYRVGDGLANTCVTPSEDAGIDSPIDGPPDLVPPTVTEHSPVSLATNVPIGAAVSVTFSEEIRPTSVTAASFTVQAGATTLAGRLVVSGAMASFVPDARLSPATMYTVTIGTGVTDLAGNPLQQAVTWTFQTGIGGWTPPQLLETDLVHSASTLRVASNRAGAAAATWYLDTTYFARYSAGTWSAAAPVPGLLAPDALTIDGQGRITAIAAGNTLLASRYEGGSWSVTPTRIDSNAGMLPNGVSADVDASGTVVAVWLQTDGASPVTSVWANRYTVAAGWGSAVQLETSTASASRPAVAMLTDGTAVATWVQSDTLYVARMAAGGQWQAAAGLGAATFSRPTVTAGPSGSAIALWRNGMNVNASRFSGAWSQAAIIPGGGTVFEGLQVLIGDSGRAVALWMAGSPGFQDLWQAVFVPASGWGPPSRIDVLAGAVNSVTGMRGAGDKLLASWSQYQGGAQSPISGWAASFDATTGWAEPQLFETDDAGSVMDVRLYYDASANTFGAVWIQGGANLPSVFFSELR